MSSKHADSSVFLGIDVGTGGVRAVAATGQGRVVEELTRAGIAKDALKAVAVAGTSGTLVALDSAGRPMRPAIIYNDPRAALSTVQSVGSPPSAVRSRRPRVRFMPD